jgi:hypothetical protein
MLVLNPPISIWRGESPVSFASQTTSSFHGSLLVKRANFSCKIAIDAVANLGSSRS